MLWVFDGMLICFCGCCWLFALSSLLVFDWFLVLVLPTCLVCVARVCGFWLLCWLLVCEVCCLFCCLLCLLVVGWLICLLLGFCVCWRSVYYELLLVWFDCVWGLCCYRWLMLTLHWFLEFVCCLLDFGIGCASVSRLLLGLLVCASYLLTGWAWCVGCLLLIAFDDSAWWFDVWIYVIFCADYCFDWLLGCFTWWRLFSCVGALIAVCFCCLFLLFCC